MKRREEDKFLTKYHTLWVLIVSFTRERLREEKRAKAGRREGGREGMGGEGDINSAEGLRRCPLER